MPSKSVPLAIRDFRGINLRDSGEKVYDNQFISTQNFYPINRGVLAKRAGSTYDLQASDVPGASSISGLFRHNSYPCSTSLIYHCKPNSTPLPTPPNNTLVLSENTSSTGQIFASANPASKLLRFAHTYVGFGIESVWDTRTRSGFIPYTGTPIHAWNQTGLQIHSMSSTTNTLTVSYNGSSFPTGVRAVNVFMAYGNAADASADQRELTYVGTLHSPTDTFLINSSLGNYTSRTDTIDQTGLGVASNYYSDGNLEPGQYYVSVGWFSDSNLAYAESGIFNAANPISPGLPVTVKPGDNAIDMTFGLSGGASTNGATHLYVFLGKKSSDRAPMVCVGIIKATTVSPAPTLITSPSLTIKDIPVNSNAQSSPNYLSTGTNTASFDNGCLMNQNARLGRTGFLVKRDAARTQTISEICLPRHSVFNLSLTTNLDIGFNGTTLPVPATVVDPSFTYFYGYTYLVNGVDGIWMTDGFTLGLVVASAGTVLPSPPVLITTFKSGLVAVTNEKNSLLYGSNALQDNNWVTGGTGTALRFVTVGDPQESTITALGVFSYTTGVDGPQSFLVAAKKASVWTITAIADPVSGVNGSMNQISGRIGCLGYRSMVQTPIGMLFLGTDGNIYLIRGSGEPARIGGLVQEAFQNLTTNDTLMKMVTACYSGYFYKISYPSTSTSTGNDAEIWADLRTEEGEPILWYGPHIGMNAGPQIVLLGIGDQQQRIACLSNGVGTVKLDDQSTFQDLGQPIVSQIISKNYRMKAAANFKRIMGMLFDVYFDNQYTHELLLEGFADENYQQVDSVLSSGSATWNSSSWDSSNWSSAAYNGIPLMFGSTNLSGRTFTFKLTHSNNAQIIFTEMDIFYQPERRQLAS